MDVYCNILQNLEFLLDLHPHFGGFRVGGLSYCIISMLMLLWVVDPGVLGLLQIILNLTPPALAYTDPFPLLSPFTNAASSPRCPLAASTRKQPLLHREADGLTLGADVCWELTLLSISREMSCLPVYAARWWSCDRGLQKHISRTWQARMLCTQGSGYNGSCSSRRRTHCDISCVLAKLC